MPLPTVTPADVKARYPVFASASDTLIALLIGEAQGAVADTWILADQKPALIAYTAHLLAIETFDTNVIDAGDLGQVAVTGRLESIEVGDVKTKFAHQYASEASGSASASALSATPYGRRYLELLRRSNPAILVV